ncbi:hypothetical protein GCM10011309_13760 [Litorimonas cladophorae]|uniref:Uncharacterized protein n=1 Tax=Litorimonas cladophorae TaxID=1220491 RepID=A0A918NDM2_9PROT|nr:hypothetical protein GCM10011309_13760 [Litorimonas cladophorae]
MGDLPTCLSQEFGYSKNLSDFSRRREYVDVSYTDFGEKINIHAEMEFALSVDQAP